MVDIFHCSKVKGLRKIYERKGRRERYEPIKERKNESDKDTK
jgi:hypothetical protein